jgi:hypothetical protein
VFKECVIPNPPHLVRDPDSASDWQPRSAESSITSHCSRDHHRRRRCACSPAEWSPRQAMRTPQTRSLQSQSRLLELHLQSAAESPSPVCRIVTWAGELLEADGSRSSLWPNCVMTCVVLLSSVWHSPSENGTQWTSPSRSARYTHPGWFRRLSRIILGSSASSMWEPAA